MFVFTTLFGVRWARFLGFGGISARAGILEGVDSSILGVVCLVLGLRNWMSYERVGEGVILPSLACGEPCPCLITLRGGVSQL